MYAYKFMYVCMYVFCVVAVVSTGKLSHGCREEECIPECIAEASQGRYTGLECNDIYTFSHSDIHSINIHTNIHTYMHTYIQVYSYTALNNYVDNQRSGESSTGSESQEEEIKYQDKN